MNPINRGSMQLSLFLAAWLFATTALAGMGMDDAKHLLLRTGFSATPKKVANYSTLTREQAVDKLLTETHSEALTPPPAWLNEPELLPRDTLLLEPTARKQAVAERIQRALQLRAWWLTELSETTSPLTERMTLFWHNHFVSSIPKVQSLRLMFNQNALLRREAVGNFGTLLHAIARDPAMIVYLDSHLNRKGKPNENFAREVMELFTLGEGHYNEQDIREAARAFTGWTLDRKIGTVRKVRALHDDTPKTIFGKTGNWSGEDVLDMLLSNPQTARYISAKLWQEFISIQPTTHEQETLAQTFHHHRYEIKPLLRSILISDAFWSMDNRGTLLKSPVEFLIGTVHEFELSGATNSLQLARLSRQLGQDLFVPPNVKGWPGGTTWITSATLLARHQFIERIFRTRNLPTNHSRQTYAHSMEEILEFDDYTWLSALPGPEASRRRTFTESTLARPPVAPLPPESSERVEFARAIALDLSYQLK